MRAPLLVLAITVFNGVVIAVSARVFPIRGPVFSFLLTWLMLTWLVVVGTAIRWQLPAGWYRLRPIEQGGQLYERLGVRIAKRLLRRGPLSILSRNMRLPARPTIDDLRHLYQLMKDAETSHVLAFGVVVTAAIAAGLARWWDSAGWLLLFDALLNVYPVMLQRYNRGLLARRLGEEGPGPMIDPPNDRGQEKP